MRIPLFTSALVRQGSVEIGGVDAIDAPAKFLKVFRSMVRDDSDQEHFIVVALGVRLGIVGAYVASIGTQSATMVHPREVFRRALLLGAHSIIVGHNHPSGNPLPSAEDLAVTERLIEAAQILDVPLVDSVVVGHSSAYSIRHSTFL